MATGALLTQAVEAEVSEFLAATADLKTDDGCRRVVRHGHLPERQIMTGIGAVAVRQPRVRDREAADGERIRFSPTILPPYARRTKSLEVPIPILYLKGVSTGDFEEALGALLGKDGGLSASTITRLKEAWVDEHARWLDRDLSAKRYVYVWADGIYVQARLEDDAQCLLVIIGATWPGARPTALRTGARSPISRCHPPAMIGRAPLGSRTALPLLSLRVDTLILVRPTKAKSNTFRLRHEILSTPTAAYSSPTTFPICFA